MGKIIVAGMGRVQIAGQQPTPDEIEAIRRVLADRPPAPPLAGVPQDAGTGLNWRRPPPPRGGLLSHAQAVGTGFNDFLAALAGLPMDAVRDGLAFAGVPVENVPRGAEALRQGMYRLNIPADNKRLEDFLGRPPTDSEKIAMGAGEGIGEAVLGAGAVGTIARTAKAAKAVSQLPSGSAVKDAGRAIVGEFRKRPARYTAAEVTAGSGAGTGQKAAEQFSPDDPTAQMAGGLVGGTAPAAAASTPTGFAVRALKKAAGAVSPSARGQAATESVARDLSGAPSPGADVRVPYVGETENIARGRAAVENVLANQESIPSSMVRQDVGEITFDWGVPGTPSKEYVDGWGLSHIIARRGLERVDGEAFVRDVLPDMIARGRLDRVYGAPDGRRADIVLGENKAVLSLYRHNDRETWVLTGFGPKAGPGEPGGVTPAAGLRTPPPRISDDVGAGPEPNIGAVPPAGNQDETTLRDLKRLREQGGDAAPVRAGPDQATPEGRPAGPAGAAARITGTELAPLDAPFPVLRRRAEDWYNAKLVDTGATVTNVHDGRVIRFERAGAGKTNTAGEDILRMVSAIPDMLRAGRPLDTRPDRRGRSNVIAWHRYAATVDVGDQRRNVTLTVRERTDGTYHYSLHREDGDAGAGSRGPRRIETQGQEANRPYDSGPGAGANIAQDGAGIKPRTTAFGHVNAPFDPEAAFKVQTRGGRLFYRTPDEQAAAAFFRPGDLAAARRSHAAFKDDPEAAQALTATALDSLRAAAVRDGVLDPKRLATWVRRHQSVLAEFPEIGAATGNHRAANRALAARQGQLASRMKTVNDSLLVRRLGAVESGGATPEALIANAVGDPRLMTAVLGGVRQDPGALEALRRHVWDQATGLPAGELIKFMHANRASLRRLFSSAHLGNLRRVQQARAIVESVPAPRGRSWQASAIDPFARLMRARSVDRRAALYREALYNPALARDLAGLAFAGKGAEARAQRLNAWLFDVGLSGPEDDER